VLVWMGLLFLLPQQQNKHSEGVQVSQQAL
jgi:hypothetical protein